MQPETEPGTLESTQDEPQVTTFNTIQSDSEGEEISDPARFYLDDEAIEERAPSKPKRKKVRQADTQQFNTESAMQIDISSQPQTRSQAETQTQTQTTSQAQSQSKTQTPSKPRKSPAGRKKKGITLQT